MEMGETETADEELIEEHGPEPACESVKKSLQAGEDAIDKMC